MFLGLRALQLVLLEHSNLRSQKMTSLFVAATFSTHGKFFKGFVMKCKKYWSSLWQIYPVVQLPSGGIFSEEQVEVKKPIQALLSAIKILQKSRHHWKNSRSDLFAWKFAMFVSWYIFSLWPIQLHCSQVLNCAVFSSCCSTSSKVHTT